MNNSKMKKVSKLRTSNENVSPLMIELDDNRGLRYLQSTTMSPGFQPYAAENFDVTGSPSQLAKYLYAVSPISAKSSDSFNSPIYGSSKYRLAKTPPYSGNSSGGSSSFSSRGRLSLSPLSSIENLERKQLSSPRMYQTPVKGGEEVIVMDDIQVRPMSGGKNRRSSSSSSSSSSGRGSSSSSSSSSKSVLFKKEVCRAWEESGNCRYDSKCQFAHGREELHPSCLSMKSKSEAQMGRFSMRAGLCLYDPDSRIVPESAEVAESGPLVTRLARSQPASPEPHRTHASPDSRIVPETTEVAESAGPVVTRLARSQPTSPQSHRTPVNPNTISDWSPLDDGIEAVLPNGSDRVPSREEVDAYIFGILNQPTTKRRLPVFAALCEGQ